MSYEGPEHVAHEGPGKAAKGEVGLLGENRLLFKSGFINNWIWGSIWLVFRTSLPEGILVEYLQGFSQTCMQGSLTGGQAIGVPAGNNYRIPIFGPDG